MAECVECGKKLGFLEQSVGGLCSQCNYLSTISPDEVEQLDQVKRDWENTQEQLSIEQTELDSITITTEAVPNLKIVKRIDVISAQAAFEINNFKDMFVGFMNPAKGRSNELKKLCFAHGHQKLGGGEYFLPLPGPGQCLHLLPLRVLSATLASKM